MSRISVSVAGTSVVVEANQHEVSVVPKPKTLPLINQVGPHTFSVIANGRLTKVIAHVSDGNYHVLTGAVPVDVSVESERTRLLKHYAPVGGATTGKKEITAPMPALVVKVLVQVGDEVSAGQGLVVLEAMKMENEIKAHVAGRIKEIRAKKASAVAKGEILLSLE